MRISAFCLALAMGVPLGAGAQVSINIQLPGLVTVAPPPLRYERVPLPRGGQVWVTGHWAWDDDAYAWRAGQWRAARPDHAYVPGRWMQADNGWRWVEGDWKRHKVKHRDRDHDGDRDRDHERRRGHDRYDRDDDRHSGGGRHCPPGQAKKGHC